MRTTKISRNEEFAQKQPIEAVILDMDGLMIDTEALGLWAWQRAVQDFGLFLPEEVFHQMVGLSRVESDKVLIKYFGPAFQLEKARERRIQHGKDYVARFGIKIKPGLFELLEFLEQRDIPRAIATSTIREITLERLRSAQLEGRFRNLVTGDEVQNGKPAPDIFLLAATRLNVGPKHCLVVEDSENGVRAASNAGMSVVMVPDLKHPSKEIEELTVSVCENLLEVRNLLESLFSKTN